jgi:hypothetical protein
MLRKLPRVTLNVLTALSLLLCLGACVLWVQSHWDNEHYIRLGGGPGDSFYILHMEPGGVTFRRVEYADPRTGQLVVSSDRFLAVPYLGPALLFAVLPAARIGARWAGQKQRRLRLGLCVRCGYDLRATPGRCPECGAAASKPS